jgi:hypothetical protein
VGCGKFWFENITEWKWSSAFLCKKKYHPLKVTRSYSLYFGVFQVAPCSPSRSRTQKGGIVCRVRKAHNLLASRQVISGGKRQLNWRNESPTAITLVTDHSSRYLFCENSDTRVCQSVWISCMNGKLENLYITDMSALFEHPSQRVPGN